MRLRRVIFSLTYSVRFISSGCHCANGKEDGTSEVDYDTPESTGIALVAVAKNAPLVEERVKNEGAEVAKTGVPIMILAAHGLDASGAPAARPGAAPGTAKE